MSASSASRPRASRATRGDPRPRPGRRPARPLITFERLKWVSFVHSIVYLALLCAAFLAGQPQPETFVLGLTHGCLWIAMSLVCLAAVHQRVLPLRVAVAVAVLGGIGPFFGSYEFVREQRRREAQAEGRDGVVAAGSEAGGRRAHRREGRREASPPGETPGAEPRRG